MPGQTELGKGPRGELSDSRSLALRNPHPLVPGRGTFFLSCVMRWKSMDFGVRHWGSDLDSVPTCGTLGTLFDFSASQPLGVEGGDTRVHFAGCEGE